MDRITSKLRFVAVIGWLALGISCAGKDTAGKDVGAVVTPLAVMQTAPVPNSGDAADDPAIWIHPSDPGLSLIIGTNKGGGLIVYDMDGKELQTVNPTCKPDNVDVVYGFPIDGGRKIDLAIASTRGLQEEGVKVWSIDPQTRKLTDVTIGKRDVIAVFGKTIPYGICTYHSLKTGKFHFFVNNKAGGVEQWELFAKEGKIDAKLNREFKLPTMVEGAVADDELGVVYIGEESGGIWKLGAEPDATDKPRLIHKVGEHGLTADVEGLTIYNGPGGTGYLIASSQGNNTFKIYDRRGDNAFIMTIDPKKGAIDDVDDTDGIAVTNSNAGPKFPKGFFIVQDGHNDGGNQNFKIYRWEDIAGDKLMIDTTSDPRKPVKVAQ